MKFSFVRALQSEWLKRKRSLASWLIIAGSCFTPCIVILIRLIQHKQLPKIYASEAFWIEHWKSSWESMAVFLLPMCAILATSLIAQLEFRNNTWKQVHALPITLGVIFFAKFAIVLVMVGQFLLIFNFGIYLSGALPGLIVLGHLPMPAAIPYRRLLFENLSYFVDCLPILALQHGFSLYFRNFLVSVGLGFLLWVGALASLSWKFHYTVPYAYPILDYVRIWNPEKLASHGINLHLWALGYFAVFTAVGFMMLAAKNEKG